MRKFIALVVLIAGCGEIVATSTTRVSGPGFLVTEDKSYVDGEWVAANGRLPIGAEHILPSRHVRQLDPRYASREGVMVASATSPGMRSPELWQGHARRGYIIGSKNRPMYTTGDETFVENDSEFLIDHVRVDGKEMYVQDLGRPEHIGLYPHGDSGTSDKLWFPICTCGMDQKTGQCRPFMPGMQQAKYCRHTVEFDAYTPDYQGPFIRKGTHRGRGCAWNIYNPKSTDPINNHLVIEAKDIGEMCN